ncbi:hypothetical protein F975_03105 [Acinetobacter sp. ANC 3789]|nr:hypothetical protein F975_03105 [Acinetobacter sp. ANC 3789]
MCLGNTYGLAYYLLLGTLSLLEWLYLSQKLLNVVIV